MRPVAVHILGQIDGPPAGVGELPTCGSEGTPQPGRLLQRPTSNVCELEAQQGGAPRGPDDSDLGGASSLPVSEVGL